MKIFFYMLLLMAICKSTRIMLTDGASKNLQYQLAQEECSYATDKYCILYDIKNNNFLLYANSTVTNPCLCKYVRNNISKHVRDANYNFTQGDQFDSQKLDQIIEKCNYQDFNLASYIITALLVFIIVLMFY